MRRQICLTLEEMNIQPESSHHEQGPGQNEVDFRYAEALEAADNFVTFKWVVKSMASSSGLFASFLPKPLPHAPGSGLHLSVSINKICSSPRLKNLPRARALWRAFCSVLPR